MTTIDYYVKGKMDGFAAKFYRPEPNSSYSDEEKELYIKGYNYAWDSLGGMEWLEDDNFDYDWNDE
jgi:hypothetical protein